MDSYSLFLSLIYYFLFSIIFLAIVTGFITSIGVITIHSCAIYNIGKNLNLNHKYFAFIPILKYYYFGKIAEKCSNENNFKKRKYSLILTTFSIIDFIIYVILLFFTFLFSLFTAQNQVDGTLDISSSKYPIIILSIMAIFLLITLIQKIYFYIANYKILEHYDSDKATIYTVISILLGALGLGIITLHISYQKERLSKNQISQ